MFRAEVMATPVAVRHLAHLVGLLVAAVAMPGLVFMRAVPAARGIRAGPARPGAPETMRAELVSVGLQLLLLRAARAGAGGMRPPRMQVVLLHYLEMAGRGALAITTR